MNRDIYNLAEWSESDLKNVRNKINLELDNRRNARDYEMREKVRTVLLEYADFCDTYGFTNKVGWVEDDDFREVPVYLSQLIDWFAPVYN